MAALSLNQTGQTDQKLLGGADRLVPLDNPAPRQKTRKKKKKMETGLERSGCTKCLQ